MKTLLILTLFLFVITSIVHGRLWIPLGSPSFEGEFKELDGDVVVVRRLPDRVLRRIEIKNLSNEDVDYMRRLGKERFKKRVSASGFKPSSQKN